MTGLKVGDPFPDFTLPDHRGTPKRLSGYTAPSPVDERLGFTDGYPVVVIFGRGFFCPRDQRHMRNLVPFQDELRVNYCMLVSVSVDAPHVQAAFRAGLGAEWPFLSDEGREVIKGLGILDETEGEYADVSRSFAFVLRPDLTVHKIYDGWFFVGRPTTEELRMDLREIMETRANYRYNAYDTEEAKKVRIPQKEWLDGAPPLGDNGLPVASGAVKTFDLASGNGEISREDGEPDVFFNFTAIPGEGYRTIRTGTPVRFFGSLKERPDRPPATFRGTGRAPPATGSALPRERHRGHGHEERGARPGPQVTRQEMAGVWAELTGISEER